MCVALSYKGFAIQEMQRICTLAASAVQPRLHVTIIALPRAAAAVRAHTGSAIVVVSLGISFRSDAVIAFAT